MQVALRDFDLSAGRIEKVADHIDSEVAQAHLPLVRERHETLGCGSIVILSGFFETFLRDVVQAYIRDVNAISAPFSSLPKRMRTTHYSEGAALLHRVARGRARWVRDTQEGILGRLQTVQLAPPYELVWEAFADTGSNPDAETVKAVLARCDISEAWKAIAARSRRKRTALTLKTALDNFIALRHECAHTGRASIVPTTSTLRDNVESLRDIASGIAGVLVDRVNTL